MPLRAEFERRAVIDVGTNSVKVLLADVCGRQVQPRLERSHQTRLGKGFYKAHRLAPEPIAATADTVAQYARLARDRGASQIRVIATSAAREARNARDLISAIRRRAKLPVAILSGDQEAKMVFQGVTTDPDLASGAILLLDVGGGSTEVILGQGHRQIFSGSFPLGSVRLMETLPHSEPPKREELGACRDWLQNFLEQEVRPELTPAFQLVVGASRRQVPGTFLPRIPDSPGDRVSPIRSSEGISGRASQLQLVGAGGTASILARMEARLATFQRDRIEGTRLTGRRLQRHVNHLWNLPLAERKRIVGLPRNRADVILYGSAIYEAVMVAFGFGSLRVTTRGLRFAAVLDDSVH